MHITDFALANTRSHLPIAVLYASNGPSRAGSTTVAFDPQCSFALSHTRAVYSSSISQYPIPITPLNFFL
jgi:hypothetical protein